MPPESRDLSELAPNSESTRMSDARTMPLAAMTTKKGPGTRANIRVLAGDGSDVPDASAAILTNPFPAVRPGVGVRRRAFCRRGGLGTHRRVGVNIEHPGSDVPE